MLRHLVCTTAAAVLAAALVVPATASPPRDEVEQEQGRVQEELSQTEDDLEHVAGELVAASARLEELQQQVPAARSAVAAAETAAGTARERDAALEQEVRLAEAELEAAGVQLSQRAESADQTQAVVAGVAREVYQGAGFNGITMLMEAESAQQYTDMVVLASTARRTQQQSLGRLRVQQAEIRNGEARLAAERTRVADLKVLAAEQVLITRAAEQESRDAQAELDSLVGEQSDTVAAFEAAKAEEEAAQAALLEQASALETQLAAIAAEELRVEAERQARLAAEAAEAAEQRRLADEEASRRAAAGQAPVPRQAPAPAPEPALRSGGELSYPVQARISSHFGYRIHPILGTRRLHTGTDFAAPCGTPVVAATDGTVVSAGVAGGYGNQVVLRHGVVRGVSLATSYNHLSRFAVTSGPVSRGQVIAYVGTTGMSTGCHLHFETRESGAPVDPRNWL